MLKRKWKHLLAMELQVNLLWVMGIARSALPLFIIDLLVFYLIELQTLSLKILHMMRMRGK